MNSHRIVLMTIMTRLCHTDINAEMHVRTHRNTEIANSKQNLCRQCNRAGIINTEIKGGYFGGFFLFRRRRFFFGGVAHLVVKVKGRRRGQSAALRVRAHLLALYTGCMAHGHRHRNDYTARECRLFLNPDVVPVNQIKCLSAPPGGGI